MPESEQVLKPEEKVELKSLPTRGLQPFARNIWIADGPNVRDMGVMFTTRMMVVKLSSGSIWINSPVPSSFDTLQSITHLGPVKYLVAGTQRHVWRLDSWHTLFPEAQLWSPRTTPFTLKKGNLPFTGFLQDVPEEGWKEDLDQLAFKGSPGIEEAIFYHKESHTVILDDLIQIHPPIEGKTFHNVLFKLEGVSTPYGGVGLDIRLTFTNRKLARRSLERLLSWDFDKLIIAHGPCIEKDAKPFVERAFQWLLD
jgi:hypothetical protein